MSGIARSVGQVVGLMLLALIALQLYFIAQLALAGAITPRSTPFQRSEIWRMATTPDVAFTWRQQPVGGAQISNALRRAVIASEDAGFTEHSGVEWDAIEKALEKNERAQARAEKANAQAAARAAKQSAKAGSQRAAPVPPPPVKQPKIVGGSTISQQLAKNLFLSGERNMLRKGQEIAITLAMEAMLPKDRILNLYLNSVEWGQGVFGAEAAAQRYFNVSAERLTAPQAARLAVMLPAPKRFEKTPGSRYVAGRSSTILARMGAVELP